MSARRLSARAVVVAGAAALLLSGCVSSGTVTDKSYSEPYTFCGGTPVVCHDEDECWQLHLRSNRGDLGEVCVPREVWESHPVGSYYEGGGSS